MFAEAINLGAAGLLDGKRATTHWKVAHELAARCRASRVEPDAIHVRDGTTYSSARVTAGIDLALALVEEDHGPGPTGILRPRAAHGRLMLHDR